ncbi:MULTISPECIES: ABC transporter ATP-binding protein [Peptoniphilus]|jgi:ABC superfamily ATP binding cassette transporter, ABC protein|uniref:ABC transporter ATP-binding protein n=1 Tax=Peptoniphilus TaxID=162289 RepID=UPI0008D9FE9C|nr:MULTISPECIES: ATP-binding cassette domain-containing protein [Peptoniphilus]MDU1043560.1 ATP-binding cassette domain-containing protein [Peptoniphilus rhinitidis]MDU1954275.1 ATP-binding cassette domain-containing protein [Peptoniphilus lacydonensis]MDU2110603.1 ATP-binding cassette domain-containing protein [Peptoniphilus lacydonensis]MDU2115634.1 ATP-binding cassette domain-containing protein [Peptoniphilus lacydonensis]MDU3751061.1 ATP-binding cassette domain-containing protein [Peptonip
MTKVLEIENLKKFYGENCVLNNISLEIEEKSIYGLIGPNGAGKSTLMKSILGLIKRDSGTINLYGKNITEKNQKEMNKNLGSLIENPSFYDHLTACENLDIVCELKGIDKKEIKNILNDVGLSNYINKKVREYSLGMKQRLGIAIALIGNPKFLILDEPINGLDPQGIEEMRNLFKSIVKNSNTSILISSHILDEIEKISTHIGILKNGNLIYNGSLENYRKLHPPVIVIKTSDNIKASKILRIDSSNIIGNKLVLGNKTKEEVAKIIKYLNNYVDIYRIEEEKESLEKLFIKETNK